MTQRTNQAAKNSIHPNSATVSATRLEMKPLERREPVVTNITNIPPSENTANSSTT